MRSLLYLLRLQLFRPPHKKNSHKKDLSFFIPRREKRKTENMPAAAGDGQCEVVLVGCGAPKRGMGWYHAVQMLKDKCPSAKMCFIVEPWFMGAGTFLILASVQINSLLT